MSKLLSIVSIVFFLHNSLVQGSFKGKIEPVLEHKDIVDTNKKVVPESKLIPGRPSVTDISRVATLDAKNQEVKKSLSQSNQLRLDALPEQKILSQEPKVLDLTNLRTDPVMTRTPYKIIDPNKIEASHPVQRYEKGVPIKFNEKMNGTIHDYINIINRRYTKLARIAPEIFATYVVEFLKKLSGNFYWGIPFTGTLYDPFQFSEKSFDKWIDTINYDTKSYRPESSLSNLYLGMQFLETINFSQNYSLASKSGNRWMTADMDHYVEVLRPVYPHVPDVILESYITAYLKNPENQKYVQVEQNQQGLFGLLGIKKLVNTNQLIPITPEMLLDATKGEMLDSSIFSGLKMPQFEGKFDPTDLKDFHKLYLTMEAIESINKNYPEEYKTIVTENGLQMQNQKNFQDKKNAAISSEGSFDSFLLRFNIPIKNLTNYKNWNIQGSARINLESNYPSYKEFMTHRSDTQAFEQLQIDFINLSQDILAAERMMGSFGGKQQLQSLIHTAIELKERMNKAIVDQKISNFMENDLPSENHEILIEDAFSNFKQLVAKEGGDYPSEIQNILNEQNNQIKDKIQPVLVSADNQIGALRPDGLDLYALSDLIETKKRDVAKTATKLDNFRLFNNEQSYYIQKAVVGHLEFVLKKKSREYNEIKSKADQIVLSIDQLSLPPQKIIEHTLQEFLQVMNSQKDSAAIKKVINDLISEYQNKDFVSQDIGKITEKLEELIKRYNNNENLKIYNQVFIDLHEKLAPDQFAKQQKIKLDTQVGVYIDNARSNGTSLAALIKKVEKKILDLQNKMESQQSLNQTNLNTQDRLDLNQGLKKSDGSIPEILQEFPSFEIASNEDIIKIYFDILEELNNRRQQELENSGGYQFRQKMYDGLENIWNKNFSQGTARVGDAVIHIPDAVGEVNTVLTSYVDSVLGSMKKHLGGMTLAGIATIIAAVSPILVQINQSNASDDEKKKMQQEALAAMMTDIGNLVIADQTGASVDVVAGGDAQAIATSGIFNKAINVLVPNDPNAGFSYNSSVTSPNYVSNVSKFQAQYNPILTNQYLNQMQPTSRYFIQTQPDNRSLLYPSSGHSSYNSYNTSNSLSVY